MEKILERIRAKYAALSVEAFSAALESVSDHPIVKALEAILQDEDIISECESFEIFIKNSSLIGGIDYQIEFDEPIKLSDFFAANDSRFLLAA